MTSSVFAIRDTHTNSVGRNRARTMILSGEAQVFFIEWATPVTEQNINIAFAGLAPGDAEPSLAVLAALALNHGMDVVSCDLSPQVTVNQLNALNDGYGPYGIHSVFQPWGKGIRDRNAAATISNYFQNHPLSQIGILMFGSDHFVAEDGRNAPPLHELVRQQVPRIDCYMVNEVGNVNNG